MVELFSNLLGGIGFFILGMVLMTDSLKSLSGESMKQILHKFTGGIFSSIGTGVVVTTIFQSSHATILVTMGFVSAGVLKFEQSIGIILGANLGTTSTGWIVSWIGFKLSLGKLALPFIGIGASLKLLSKRKLGEIGLFLCGFSLLFIGIEFLQTGMKSFTIYFDPSQIPADNFLHQVALVIIGIVLTILMQSSSAALATTLSALSQNAIDLHQACYMIIGQNIGTTLTAGIAAIGASAASKRTALVHIIFNILAGVVAFVIINPLLHFFHLIFGTRSEFGAVSSAVFFHSVFNIIGILAFLPILKLIARWIENFLPDEISNPNRYLDTLLYNTPSLALDSVRRSLLEMFQTTIMKMKEVLSNSQEEVLEFTQIQRARLHELMEYFEKIPNHHISEKEIQIRNDLLHCIDHLDSLLDALGSVKSQVDESVLLSIISLKEELKETIHFLLDHPIQEDTVKFLEDRSKDLANFRKRTRLQVLNSTAQSALKPNLAMKEIDTIRWFDKVHYYLWRFSDHIY